VPEKLVSREGFGSECFGTPATHGSAAPGGGPHAPGVGAQGLTPSRPISPQEFSVRLKRAREQGQRQALASRGSDVAPAGWPVRRRPQLAAGLYAGSILGRGMMHYHVPEQHIMATAPGGIGVTNRQAVYYPPPPHMMQGDGSGQNQDGISWHAVGGGYMALRLVPSLNILMDMAGGMPTQMPWMPNGGQQYYVHHVTPQQDWGLRTHGMAYAPPSPLPPCCNSNSSLRPRCNTPEAGAPLERV
jgi:hypothetical protein